MTDSLFIGESRRIDIEKMLENARGWLTKFGIQSEPEDLIVTKLSDTERGARATGNLDCSIAISISLAGSEVPVTISRFKTEVNPEDSLIAEPFTVCVSLWVGASAVEHLLAACVAAGVAIESGGRIWDSGHEWFDIEINDVDGFIENVRKRYSQQ